MKALKEAVKEALRVILIAIIPIIIMGINTQTRTINIDWFLVEFTAIITALRFIDSWLHEAGKDSGNKTMEGGLTRF